MTKLDVLVRTFAVASNPFAVLSLIHSKSKLRAIKFKDGFTLQLTWQQFRVIRDNYTVIRQFAISQVEDDLFKLKSDKSEIECPHHLIPLMCDLMSKYHLVQLERNLFRVSGDDFELVGDSAMLLVLQEQESGEYNYDYTGKVVLDVGGYQGESAVFFHRKGAKRVIIYEPVAGNHKFISQNVAANHVNAEVHEEGIGDSDGNVSISYDNVADTSFGLTREGKHSLQIKVRNVSDVIAQSDANVAKFDCEGAEETLTRVPKDTLRKIPVYMIEVHSPELKKSIEVKFQLAGFKLTREIPKTSKISVVALERLEDS